MKLIIRFYIITKNFFYQKKTFMTKKYILTFACLFSFIWIIDTQKKVQAQTLPDLIWESPLDSVNCFGSPRTADLNGDGFLDIVIGAGVIDSVRSNGAIAINGKTGAVLWNVKAHTQVFGNPLFYDINNDNTPDVFITGRHALLKAINGKTGEVLWDFYPAGENILPANDTIFNFYSPQFIPSADNDTLPDLLLANGGNHYAATTDSTIRPPARIMVVSSANGAILADVEVPDGQETYMSPLVYDLGNDGITDVIFGTGGEYFRGGLWRVPLPSILAGNMNDAVQLVYSNPKGFIAPPAIADLNADGYGDIIVNGYNATTYAINGKTNEILWKYNLPAAETLAAPAIGHFLQNDYIPDVFVIYAKGVAPVFTEFVQIMLDGSTGENKYQKSIGNWCFASPIAVDYDNDFVDEVIICPSYTGGTFKHELRLIDFNDAYEKSLTNALAGTNLASTPFLVDINANDKLDLVYVASTDGSSFAPITGVTIRRYELQTATPFYLAWGGYLGTTGNGAYNNVLSGCNDALDFQLTLINPKCNGDNSGYIGVKVLNGKAPYVFKWQNNEWSDPSNTQIYGFSELIAGSYSLTFIDGNGCEEKATITLTQPPAITLNVSINQPTGNNANGTITAVAQNGTAPYTYLWSNGATTQSLVGLTTGSYSVVVTDSKGCSIVQIINLYAVGINSNTQLYNTVQVYPNPATQTLYINGLNALQQNYSIQLYNFVGQKMNIEPHFNNTTAEFNVQHLPKGLYYLKIETAEGSFLTKVQVQ